MIGLIGIKELFNAKISFQLCFSTFSKVMSLPKKEENNKKNLYERSYPLSSQDHPVD